MYPEISEILQGFQSISLKEMDCVKLMTRTDSKYLCQWGQLAHLLMMAQADFRILEIKGSRVHGYESLYLDTPEHNMYLDHHNGKLNRYKIRIREYRESKQFYLEIKKKDNKKNTEKQRIPITADRNFLMPAYKDFISANTPYDPEILQPVLVSSFSRITLVNTARFERITIDIGPAWQTHGLSVGLSNVVIIEVKSSRTSNCTGFNLLLREERIQPERISKYCTGTALLYADIKHNRFKNKLLHLQKLEKNIALYEPAYEPV